MAHSLDCLMKWLHRDEWRDGFESLFQRHVGPSSARAGIAFEELPSLLGEDGFRVIWGCVFEDYCAWDDERARNVADDYLKRRGWKESVQDRRYIAGLRDSVMSLYEVSDIVREESFLARDLIRGGEPVRVSEKSGTRSLRTWDRVAARIVPMEPKFVMGGGLLRIELRTGEDLLANLRAAYETGGIASLRRSAHLFTAAWLDDVLSRALGPKLPELHNSDGHRLNFSTARYRLEPRAPIVALRRALDTLPELRRETSKFWNWITTQKPVCERPLSGQTIITTLDDGSTVLGNLEIEGRTLVLSANSRERLERGRAMLAPVLEGLVRAPLVEAQTVEELMAARPAKDAVAGRSSSGLSPQEERALLHSFLDRHYREQLDERIPSLDGMSPRKAIESERGRNKVAEWLKFLENASATQTSSPAKDYDFLWLWKELGIDQLRR